MSSRLAESGTAWIRPLCLPMSTTSSSESWSACIGRGLGVALDVGLEVQRGMCVGEVRACDEA